MACSNTTAQQDHVLSACEDFGGKAAEAAEIAEELDGKLSEALHKIEVLESRQ